MSLVEVGSNGNLVKVNVRVMVSVRVGSVTVKVAVKVAVIASPSSAGTIRRGQTDARELRRR